ncbi:SMI1/KNR4 family protein [Saccharothrix sp. Mg75]|uniref:SMI1/KNR4 family protein n=1 Tax=Saccharothrix sp. Mg75 TaxID=3445357 RepID=UPI003EEBBD22
MTPIEELRRLAPPPAVPVAAPPVDPPLPEDYRSLVETYGLGEFCDLIRLESDADDLLDYEREARADYPEYYPYPIHPEPGGLPPWGATSNGDLLCWRTEGEPDAWPVVVWGLRSAEFEEHPVGAAAFLAGWLAGRLKSELLPDAFRAHSQWFDPVGPRRSLLAVRLSPHTQSLDILRAALGDTTVRRSVGDQHVVDAGDWRVTYDPQGFEITYPPADVKRVHAVVAQAAAALGCEVLPRDVFQQ